MVCGSSFYEAVRAVAARMPFGSRYNANHAPECSGIRQTVRFRVVSSRNLPIAYFALAEKTLPDTSFHIMPP
jgi:Flp pilus assembly CpaF family ATPase